MKLDTDKVIEGNARTYLVIRRCVIERTYSSYIRIAGLDNTGRLKCCLCITLYAETFLGCR